MKHLVNTCLAVCPVPQLSRTSQQTLLTSLQKIQRVELALLDYLSYARYQTQYTVGRCMVNVTALAMSIGMVISNQIILTRVEKSCSVHEVGRTICRRKDERETNNWLH